MAIIDPADFGPGGGLLGNGSNFVMPTNSSMPWFPYADLKSQMIDAQNAWGQGSGGFIGMASPMLQSVANAKPMVGGGLLGASAYSGGPNPFLNGFDPYAGRGNNYGGGGGMPPPGAGGAPTPPAGPPAMPPGAGSLPGMYKPGSPSAGAPPGAPSPPGGITVTPPNPGANPAGGWHPTIPGGLPPPGGIAGAGAITNPTVKTTPQTTQPGLGGNNTGGLLGPPKAGPNIMPTGWGDKPPAAALNDPEAVMWARSQNPADAMKLQAKYGPLIRAQMDMYFNQGGAGFDPQKSADQTRGESGGIDTLLPMTRKIYEDAGIIVNGKWAKKMDNEGNWVPV